MLKGKKEQTESTCVTDHLTLRIDCREKHLVDSSVMYVTRDKAQLTEYQIQREVLW